MYNYDSLRRHHGNEVSQTIDTPIMIFDHFELGDAFLALAVVMVFGVFCYMWDVMTVGLILVLGFAPKIRQKNNKGIFFHWPYRHLGISLPGLMNPKTKRKFSD